MQTLVRSELAAYPKPPTTKALAIIPNRYRDTLDKATPQANAYIGGNQVIGFSSSSTGRAAG
jgi:hypothetical protein